MAGLPDRFEQAGELVVAAVDKAAEARWPAAQERSRSLEGTPEQRVEALTRNFARELAGLGAATGGAAAIPGIGTFTSLSTVAADLSWFTVRSADLILSIAAVHGHTEASVEERRLWILSVLAFGDAASTSVTQLATDVGVAFGRQVTNKVPTEALKRINRLVSRTVLTRYGSKRGVIALGRALPFGIGAAFGGTSNYAFTKAIARHADRFFRDLADPHPDH